MKRILLSTLTIAATALVLMGAGHGSGEGQRGGGQRSAGQRGGGSSPSKIYRLRRVAVPKPSMPSRVVRGQGRFSYPERDESGARISKPAAAAPPQHHASVVKNTALVRNIQTQERVENTPKHYYWHNDGGLRYSHYYDGRVHWYGFYHGPAFYWTRYYGDRWWWYDGGGARWVFWWDGFWWWPGPGAAAYVYMDGHYYPYENAAVTVAHEENQAPPASIPAPNPAAAAKSPDARRMVQISGSDGQAFLYDNTTSPPTFVKFLGVGASKARFSGGSAGAPLQILVEYKDDTFALFDADGNSQSSAVQSSESQSTPPAAAPDSIPPMPTSAPGQ